MNPARPGHLFVNYKLISDAEGLQCIPEHMKSKIDLAIEIVDGSTNDWFKIKPMLINMCTFSDRTRFSRRHYSTKKQILNLFDKAVITYWKEKTGVELWVDPEKLHDPTWVRNPVGWGLFEVNRKRIENARLKRQQKQKGMPKKTD